MLSKMPWGNKIESRGCDHIRRKMAVLFEVVHVKCLPATCIQIACLLRVARLGLTRKRINSAHGVKVSSQSKFKIMFCPLTNDNHLYLLYSKRPGSTKALPVNLGSNRPLHPRIGSSRMAHASVYKQSGGDGPVQGGSKTRYQMTQDRIMDNIKYFNKPAPDT